MSAHKCNLSLYVFTGLYVDLNRDVAPKEFHGIGLRIEDDILITDSGVEVLTQSCPKTVAEIELTMRKS